MSKTIKIGDVYKGVGEPTNSLLIGTFRQDLPAEIRERTARTLLAAQSIMRTFYERHIPPNTNADKFVDQDIDLDDLSACFNAHGNDAREVLLEIAALLEDEEVQVNQTDSRDFSADAERARQLYDVLSAA